MKTWLKVENEQRKETHRSKTCRQRQQSYLYRLRIQWRLGRSCENEDALRGMHSKSDRLQAGAPLSEDPAHSHLGTHFWNQPSMHTMRYSQQHFMQDGSLCAIASLAAIMSDRSVLKQEMTCSKDH